MRYSRFVLGTFAVLALLAAPPNKASGQVLNVVATKSPISSDGTTKGAVTDVVLSFIGANPAVPGVGIYAGGTIEVILDPSFVNVGGPNGVLILQGWPQSPPAHLPWTTTVNGNRITITLLEDYLPGMYGPGPKQLHLMLYGFRNPSKRGYYPAEVRIKPHPASDEVLSDWGFIRIIPKPRPSINAMSLYSDSPTAVAPLFNPLYQTMSLADVQNGALSRAVGFYLWGADKEPLYDVELLMTGARQGRLVQNGRTVGQVELKTPAGAANFWLRPFGPSIPTRAFITREPTGLFRVKLEPDKWVTGVYRITFEMKNGTWSRFYVTVLN